MFIVFIIKGFCDSVGACALMGRQDSCSSLSTRNLHHSSIKRRTLLAMGVGRGARWAVPPLDFHTLYRYCVFHQALVLWKHP